MNFAFEISIENFEIEAFHFTTDLKVARGVIFNEGKIANFAREGLFDVCLRVVWFEVHFEFFVLDVLHKFFYPNLAD